MLLPLSGERGVGKHLASYIPKEFYRQIQISRGTDDIEITDPEDFEVDPTGQGHSIKDSDLFYNKIETAVAVAVLYQSLLWSNPSPLLLIKQKLKELGLLPKFAVTDEFLRVTLIQICEPRKKKFQNFLEVFTGRYKNDGGYSSIYNAVWKSKLHLAIYEILRIVRKTDKFIDNEYVESFGRLFSQDIVLLDDYEPVKRSYRQNQIFIYHKEEFAESPYFVLSKFKDDKALQEIFDVQKKLFLKNVQILILNMEVLEENGKEHLLTYVRETIKNGTYENFLGVLFMYDDKLTANLIRELIESKTAIKKIFSDHQSSQIDESLTQTMVFEPSNEQDGQADDDDEEYDPQDYVPPLGVGSQIQQPNFSQPQQQFQQSPQYQDDEDDDFDPTAQG